MRWLDAEQSREIDPVLDCLTYIARQADRPSSPVLLRAGLAVSADGKLPFHQIEPALEQVGMRADPVARRLKGWPSAKCPAILELEDERAAVLLRRVGLGGRLQHRPGQLSGGEQQRAAVARALVTAPRLLLADEPTGSLDADTAEGVIALLRELNEHDGLTLVVVTHEERVSRAARRIVRLRDGLLQGEVPLAAAAGVDG